MEELLTRMWQDLVNRPSGPLSARFVLQPIMATLLAVRAGIRDARSGAPPYLWTVFTDPTARRDLLRDGWKDIAKVFVIAVCLDVVFQLITFKTIYPMESFLIAVGLAIVPYSIVRGPVSRLLVKRLHVKSRDESKADIEDHYKDRAA
jgi:hypothetical protein